MRSVQDAVYAEDRITDIQRDKLIDIIHEMLVIIRNAVQQRDFWRVHKRPEQNKLKQELLLFLENSELLPLHMFAKMEQIADDLIELAKYNHTLITDD